MVKSQRSGERVMKSVKRFLERKLKLKVNEKKSWVAPASETKVLGFTFRGDKIRWSDEAFGEFKRQLKRLTGRSWFVSMKYRIEQIKPGDGGLVRLEFPMLGKANVGRCSMMWV